MEGCLHVLHFYGHLAISAIIPSQTDDDHQLTELKVARRSMLILKRMKEMGAFRKPLIHSHKYSFYLHTPGIIAHIVAVVITELKENYNIISAMFIGKNTFAKRAVDLTEDDEK